MKYICLIVLLLSNGGAAAQARQPLLADTQFAEGFGAAYARAQHSGIP